MSGQNVEVVYKHYSIEEGLPGATVYCSYQDSEGFMWFGTNMGVTRFDGKNFKTYTTREGLTDSEVFKIYEDSYKRIWFFCFNPYPCYIEAGKVYNYKNSSLIRQIKEKDFGACFVMPDTGKTFWFAASQNIYHIKKDTLDVYPAKVDGEASIYLKKEGNDIFLFTYASLFKLKGKRFERITEITSFDNFRWGISSLFFLKDTFIAVTNNAIGVENNSINMYLFNNGAPKKITGHFFDIKPYSVTVLKDNTILMATSSGIKRFNASDGETKHCSEYSFLDDRQVSLVYEDRNENLWCSTLGDGIYMIPQNGLLKYKTNFNGSVTSIYVDKQNKVYVGKNNATVTELAKEVNREIDLTGIMENTSRVGIINEIDDNHLVFGTDRGAIVYNKQSSLLKHTFPCNVKSLQVIDRNEVYLGISSGIMSFTKSNTEFKVLLRDTIRVTAINYKDSGEIWYGTLNGLRGFKCKLPNFGKWNEVLTNSRITGIEHTSNNVTYISTANMGVFVFDGHETYRIDESNGLESNSVKKIFIDGKSRVWICTNLGITAISQIPAQGFKYEVRNFDIKNGLTTNAINDICVRADTLWIASASEIFVWDIKSKKATQPIPVYIVGLLVSDSVVTTDKVKTSFRQNNIEIIYAGISYNNPDIQYKYILDGAKNDTVFTDLDRVNFSSLAPGKYMFYVWAQNSDGQWSAKPAALSLEVTPAFWQTWWFRLFIFAGSISLVVWYFLSRINILKKEQQLLRRIDELELMALKSQMNPHFVFNSLNSIQSFVNKNDTLAANKYLSSFGKLIRKTLDFSSKQHITVEEEVVYLENYLMLEKMRFIDKFNYTIEVNETGGNVKNAEIPPLILQPYVENAIRHGLRFKEDGLGILNIRFYVKENNLYCEVEDNGIGRVKAEELKSMRHVEYQSKGMSLSGNRVEALNRLAQGGIKVHVIDKYDNNIATGTLIQLTIPLHLN